MKISNWLLQLSNRVQRNGLSGSLHDKQHLENEIARWKNSPKRTMQVKGSLYYDNEHDILSRKRTMIGEDGRLQEVDNLPNNRIIDNQYAKLVNQKANYLCGRPFTLDGGSEAYTAALKTVFNKHFMKTLKNAAKGMLNNGIVWLYPYYDDSGDFSFRLFPGYEILPFWKDSEHTALDFAVRLYLVEGYQGATPVVVEKVELYAPDGVHCFTLDGGVLKPERDGADAFHVTVGGADSRAQGLNWEKIPLIPLKYNEQETPLLKKVKSLQDGINIMLSDFENSLQEDARNTIIVLKNFDGQNLGEFRRNLATFGAIKLRNDSEVKGEVETLEITVDAENYKSIIEIFKKAIIENGMGYDAKDDRMAGNPNQMNIKSMYSDADLDANEMETEMQAAFEEILWFANMHLANMGYGDFGEEEVRVIFNRDIMINESETIADCRASVGILSDETIVANHPWCENLEDELERLERQKEQEQQEMMQQYDPFGGQNKK